MSCFCLVVDVVVEIFVVAVRRVEGRDGVVHEDTVLHDQRRGHGLGVLVKQAVMPHAQAHDDVQLRALSVEQLRL